VKIQGFAKPLRLDPEPEQKLTSILAPDELLIYYIREL
jgi:hypothetical protein